MTSLLNSHSLVTLVDLLAEKSLHQPNQIAFIFLADGEKEEVKLTYQQLNYKAKAIAAHLLSMKATGERMLLLYQPGLEFITAFFGCLYAGVIAVPAYPPRRKQHITKLQAIVKDAQTTFVLTTASLLANIEHSLKQEPELAALHYIATENLASNPLVEDWQPLKVNSDALAFLQYTSGSTSMPKGVMISHANLLHNLEMIKKAFQQTEESIGVSWLPLFHDMGLIGNVLQPVYLGASSILMSPVAFLQKPLRWLSAISRYKATTSGGSNFAYDLCVNRITPQERENLDLSSWKLAFNGSEPIHAETLERFATAFALCGFRKEAFYPCYGMAEATLFVSGGLKTSPPVLQIVHASELEQNQVVLTKTNSKNDRCRVLVSCGKTWLNQKVIIVNPKTLLECSPNQVGEIWLTGASVAQGYWNRPEDTKYTFRASLKDTSSDTFLRTGDLGFFENGELFITGRLKDLIIIRGRNYYPQDIELTVEQSHAALRSGCGAAFAVEVNEQEQLVVVNEVERNYLYELDVDEVIRAIRQAVSEQYELQVHAVILLKTASIPKTSSGKIQRHLCRINFLERNLDVVGEWTANSKADLLELQTEVEALWEQIEDSRFQLKEEKEVEAKKLSQGSVPSQETIEIWLVANLALYLKIPQSEIDSKQSFAAYGLDSSVAVTLSIQLSQWLEYEIEPTVFWAYPDIKTLAQYLAQDLATE
ncbi:AMP-binding protein [Nostoc sp. ChiQUE01b]|uniref:AMP-binding protein n=1 Tax=Nostoc sp. ChiQUE01b TaxID=3075376 RepID=UPI002AD4AAE1|nr:AMP-binding protein [Nostoc sp. ChiQUE01b]MDZ8262761.1 AMP-binding protein [Nostoc sp. ChiQUE01b]